jgi:hypothetical protein
MPNLRLSIDHAFLYDGTGRVWPLTPEQMAILARTVHLVVVEALADGDLLALDTGAANPEVFPDGHFGPFILTGDGKVQDVNYHYRYGHGVGVPAVSDRPTCICSEPGRPAAQTGDYAPWCPMSE